MRRTLLLTLALAVVGTLAALPAMAGGQAGAKTWRVTVENLTDGQPLSPPLLVVHSRQIDVWSPGTIASHGVAAIAEDANNAVLEEALAGLPGVRSVATGIDASVGTAAPILPGESQTYEIATRGSQNRLSVLTMLVRTNDAFTGLDSKLLHKQTYTIEKGAYDAGSEANNELGAYIPGPPFGNAFVRDPEGKLVRHHPGIVGGDLAGYAWDMSEPVARITIEQVG